MVITSIRGQILSATVVISGSGSALPAVLIIRKARDAPQERDNTDVTSEKIWVLLNLPVLRKMNTWVKHIFGIQGLATVRHLSHRLGSCFVHRL